MKRAAISLFIIIHFNYSLADHETINRIETKVDKIFVPPTGFDSNDNIQITVTGTLSNQCLQVADTEYLVNQTHKTITVKQFAQKKTFVECKKQTLPLQLQIPSQFTQVVNLGLLDSGSYKIIYNNNLVRNFDVAQADTTNTDDEIYAPVSDIFIPEVIYETQNAEVALTGALPLCLEWKDVDVTRFDDVIAVMPKVNLIPKVPCSSDNSSIVPLEKIVGLGPLNEGKYLIHVRSMNGSGINKIVRVIKSPSPTSGRPF